MILINNVKISLDDNFNDLTYIAAKQLRTDASKIVSVSLLKRSVDARKKENVHFCCSLLVDVKENEQKIIQKCKNAQIYQKKEYHWLKADKMPDHRPIVVGFGPAGIFAALTLAKAGLKPIVIERGTDADNRRRDVESFFKTGRINPESNVQFGEGGAGTFSDGKLNTGIKDMRCVTVLEIFCMMGADRKILIDAKPHIGTDVLIDIVKRMRQYIIELGGEIRFNSKLEDLIFESKKLKGIIVNGEEIPCEALVLATGHSARDTFEMLKRRRITMMRKAFAMGVRIEHLQCDINRALYGDFASHPMLSAADYKLVVHLDDGRGVFTFCMCPGGEVINASSEENGIAINGMSNSRRDGINANSALLVSITPEDFDDDDVLAGCRLQREIEKKAYDIAGGAVPMTTVGSFLFDKEAVLGNVKPTVRPKAVFSDFNLIFPKLICDSLKEGIKIFDRKISGFAADDALLTAPETRSSSPVRIVRGEDGQSLSLIGLYPAGEGAGYAGGIMSAAVDGMRTAEKIIRLYQKHLI